MNESEFEQQLRSIQPAAPGEALERRIAAQLAVNGTPAAGRIPRGQPGWILRVLSALGWASAGAAAAVLVMFSRQSPGGAMEEPKPAQVATAPAINTTNELISMDDEGIVIADGSEPSRVVRYTSIERREWTDMNGAITSVEIPRQDVVLLPVSFQ